MILPKISRRAAVVLGKAAGAVIFTVVGGAVAWLLDQERRAIQAEAIRRAEEQETEVTIPTEAFFTYEEEAESSGEEGAGDEA